MNTVRLAAGTLLATALGVGLATAASAQTAPDYPPTGGGGGTTTSTSFETPAVGGGTPSSLPFTGAEIATAAAVGLAAVAGGAGLAVGARRRHA